jgi:hypothetical protein
VLVTCKAPLGAHAGTVAAMLNGPLANFKVDGDVIKKR